jgi:hypothetical protein
MLTANCVGVGVDVGVCRACPRGPQYSQSVELLECHSNVRVSQYSCLNVSRPKQGQHKPCVSDVSSNASTIHYVGMHNVGQAVGKALSYDRRIQIQQ